jgi:hypothetical protein
LKREYCVLIESDVIDRVQVYGNANLTLGDFIEMTLEHIMECETFDIPNFFEEPHD